MKLKEGFITHNIAGEQMMVAAGAAAEHFRGMVRSNETAAFMVDCLKQETSAEAIVEAVLAEYDAPRETVERDVAAVLEKLRSIGALE